MQEKPAFYQQLFSQSKFNLKSPKIMFLTKANNITLLFRKEKKK